MGHVVSGAELFTTSGGASVAHFTVALNRQYKGPSGLVKKVTWARVIVWGSRAKACKEFLYKGALVFLEGFLENSSWTDKGGVKRTSMHVVANNVRFLSRKKNE